MAIRLVFDPNQYQILKVQKRTLWTHTPERDKSEAKKLSYCSANEILLL